MPTFKEALDRSSELASLIQQARSRTRLKDQLSVVLPPALTRRLHFRDEGDVLTIIAPSSAQAAKLRQMLVSMSDHFRAQGRRFDRIRITVARSIGRPESPLDDDGWGPIIDRPQISRQTIDRIALCAERLSDRPKLAGTLSRIAARLSSR